MMSSIWRLKNGKAVEFWINMDTLGLLEQMGLDFEMKRLRL